MDCQACAEAPATKELTMHTERLGDVTLALCDPCAVEAAAQLDEVLAAGLPTVQRVELSDHLLRSSRN